MAVQTHYSFNRYPVLVYVVSPYTVSVRRSAQGAESYRILSYPPEGGASLQLPPTSKHF